jgi:ubiquitin carboxyl-terminal hydrolase 7
MPTSYGLGSTLTYNNNLLYEVLELSLSELETKKSVRLTWLPEGISKEESHEFLVPKQGQLLDLVDLLQEKAKIKPEDMQRLRFFLSSQGKFQKDLDLNFSVAGLQDYTTLYAELAPLEELDLKDDERVAYAFHFYREPSKAHVNGVPFKFVVKAGEPFSETRTRLQKRTGIKGKQFEKIKFAVVQKASFSKPKYLEDGKFCFHAEYSGGRGHDG